VAKGWLTAWPTRARQSGSFGIDRHGDGHVLRAQLPEALEVLEVLEVLEAGNEAHVRYRTTSP
jgi:hypothetical protein